jgi:hypothetical protein
MPDPVVKPWQTPYSSMDNNPIAINDVYGLDGEDCGGSAPSPSTGGVDLGGGNAISGASNGDAAGNWTSTTSSSSVTPPPTSVGDFTGNFEHSSFSFSRSGNLGGQTSRKPYASGHGERKGGSSKAPDREIDNSNTPKTSLQTATLFTIKAVAKTLNKRHMYLLQEKVSDQKATANHLFYQWANGIGPNKRMFNENSVMGKQMLTAPEVKKATQQAAKQAIKGNWGEVGFARSLVEEGELSYVQSFAEDITDNPARAFHGSFSGSVTVTDVEPGSGGVWVSMTVTISDNMTAASGTRAPPFLGGYNDGNGGVNAIFPEENPYGPDAPLNTIKINYEMKIKVFVPGIFTIPKSSFKP